MRLTTCSSLTVLEVPLYMTRDIQKLEGYIPTEERTRENGICISYTFIFFNIKYNNVHTHTYEPYLHLHSTHVTHP